MHYIAPTMSGAAVLLMRRGQKSSVTAGSRWCPKSTSAPATSLSASEGPAEQSCEMSTANVCANAAEVSKAFRNYEPLRRCVALTLCRV